MSEQQVFPWPWVTMGGGGIDPFPFARGGEDPWPRAGEEVPFPWFRGGEVPFPWLVNHVARVAESGLAEGGGEVSIAPTEGPVHDVVSVSLTSAEGAYPDLYMVAVGKTRTLGWRKAALLPRVYIVPPADGIYDFDMIAIGGSCLTAIGSVIATMPLIERPEGFKGVRVHPGGLEARP